MKKTPIMLVSICLALLLSACGEKRVERTVTIAYNPGGYGSAVSQIMVAENILDKYLPDDVTAEWVEMSSANDIRDALASNAVNIAAPALSAFITAYENDMPITLISNYGNAVVNLYSNKGYGSISDFNTESDAIAIKGLNTNPQIAFLAYVKECGLDVAVFNSMLTKIPEAESIALLNDGSGEIAGAVLSYPVSKKAEAIEGVTLVADFSEVIDDYNLGNCLCANTDFYQNNQDIVRAFESARDEIIDGWNSNLEHNADVLSDHYGYNLDELKPMMVSLPPKKEVTGYDKLSELMYQCGIIEHPAEKFSDLSNYAMIPK